MRKRGGAKGMSSPAKLVATVNASLLSLVTDFGYYSTTRHASAFDSTKKLLGDHAHAPGKPVDRTTHVSATHHISIHKLSETLCCFGTTFQSPFASRVEIDVGILAQGLRSDEPFRSRGIIRPVSWYRKFDVNIRSPNIEIIPEWHGREAQILLQSPIY